MNHDTVSARTIRVIKVSEADLREALGLADSNELTSAIAEPEVDGSSRLVLTFSRRDA